jgi:hypothetical protein
MWYNMVIMHFGGYMSDLDSHALRVLTDAFDQAWAELAARESTRMVDEPTTRDALGRRIIAAAINEGAKDSQKLKRMALEGFEM